MDSVACVVNDLAQWNTLPSTSPQRDSCRSFWRNWISAKGAVKTVGEGAALGTAYSGPVVMSSVAEMAISRRLRLLLGSIGHPCTSFLVGSLDLH